MKIICIEAKKVIGTSVAETVVRLDKKKPKEYVEIGVDAEDYYKIKDSEEVSQTFKEASEAGVEFWQS